MLELVLVVKNIIVGLRVIKHERTVNIKLVVILFKIVTNFSRLFLLTGCQSNNS